jgi:uncharacterized protein GlcG (DUF336 family)
MAAVRPPGVGDLRALPGAGDWGLSTVLGGRIVGFAGGLPIRSAGRLVG